VGAKRVLIMRLTVEGRGIGIVEVYRTEDRPFRKDDPRQVDLLVSFAANAYSRIQLATRLESHYTETIEALVSALEARDPATQAHTGRIRDIATAVGVAMHVPSDVLRSVRLGAILHDVGKIGISDAILTKPGPLTEAEWKVMRAHPLIGERMLQGVAFLEPVLPVVRHHHERWDGRGYPDRLVAERIPIAARIVAACDAFDAMASDRPYRAALPLDIACREIVDCAGSQFDPKVARTLIEVVQQMTGENDLETKFVRYAV
jgi:HD-GYP domain-containing protein (c-di-GMP phosphodiesterase class II)